MSAPSNLDMGSLSFSSEFKSLLCPKNLILQSISNSIFTVLISNQSQLITESKKYKIA